MEWPQQIKKSIFKFFMQPTPSTNFRGEWLPRYFKLVIFFPLQIYTIIKISSNPKRPTLSSIATECVSFSELKTFLSQKKSSANNCIFCCLWELYNILTTYSSKIFERKSSFQSHYHPTGESHFWQLVVNPESDFESILGKSNHYASHDRTNKIRNRNIR